MEKLDARLPVQLIRTDAVALEEPQKVGHYSHSKSSSAADRNNNGKAWAPSPSPVKYLHVPSEPVSLDLLDGYDDEMTYYGGSGGNPKINTMLRWLMNDRTGAARRLLDSSDFFTARSVLSYVLSFPYEKFDPLSVCATKWRGKIYLSPHYGYHQDSTGGDNNNNHIQQNKGSFAGLRFKQYMTGADPDTPPDPYAPYSAHYRGTTAVVSARLLDKYTHRFRHSMVYTSGLDCIDPDVYVEDAGDQTLANAVDLKSAREVSKGRQLPPGKRLKWWSQAFLSGAPTICCGYRDDDFVVRRVERLEVCQLAHNTYWSTIVCLNFLNRFLTFVKEVTTGADDPRVVYVFALKPRSQHISCTRLADPGDEFQVLPDWYISSN